MATIEQRLAKLEELHTNRPTREIKIILMERRETQEEAIIKSGFDCDEFDFIFIRVIEPDDRPVSAQ